jgi:5-methylcytosine-specific restriction endonuclease McrA
MCLNVLETPYSYDYGAVEKSYKAARRNRINPEDDRRSWTTPYMYKHFPKNGWIFRRKSLYIGAELREGYPLKGEVVHSYQGVSNQGIGVGVYPRGYLRGKSRLLFPSYSFCVLGWGLFGFAPKKKPDVGSLALYVPFFDQTKKKEARKIAVQTLNRSPWEGRWDRTKEFLRKWCPPSERYRLIEEYEDIEF